MHCWLMRIEQSSIHATLYSFRCLLVDNRSFLIDSVDMTCIALSPLIIIWQALPLRVALFQKIGAWFSLSCFVPSATKRCRWRISNELPSAYVNLKWKLCLKLWFCDRLLHFYLLILLFIIIGFSFTMQIFVRTFICIMPMLLARMTNNISPICSTASVSIILVCLPSLFFRRILLSLRWSFLLSLNMILWFSWRWLEPLQWVLVKIRMCTLPIEILPGLGIKTLTCLLAQLLLNLLRLARDFINTIVTQSPGPVGFWIVTHGHHIPWINQIKIL